MSEKWEYRLMTISPDRDPSSIEDALKGEGDDGWELVTTYTNANSGNHAFIFKRPAARTGYKTDLDAQRS
jgi:hypothetical protein